MATLKEMTYDILEAVNAYSDDTKFSEEHIVFMINTNRNLLLKQYMSDMKKEIPQEALQNINVKLKLDPNCLDEFKIVKSISKIPSTLDNTGRSNIVKAYIKGSSMYKHINIIDESRLPFVSADPFNNSLLFVTVDSKSYLQIYNQNDRHILMEDIEIEAVFENPEEAYKMSSDYDPNIDFYDTQYPVESAMIPLIKNQIVNQLIAKFKIPTDEINNGEDVQVKV